MTESSQQGASGIGKMMGQLKNTVGSDVGGVINKIKNSGLSEHFKSWVGKGENKPVTADQVSQALGNEQLAKIADQTGVSQQQAAQNIADKLPGMVDKMTPDGDAAPITQGMASAGSAARDAAGRMGMGGGTGSM
jgi:uncharacterized protein YidB (DUF937 family)